MSLDLDPRLLATLVERVLARATVRDRAVSASPREAPPSFDLESGGSADAVLTHVLEGIERGAVHPTSPRYFGPPTATPADITVVAEALLATYGLQLATTEHAPFAVEIERQVLAALGARLGMEGAEATFTTGGAESNLIAVVSALVAAFPEMATDGLRALPADPIVYASAEAHPTIVRAARLAGLGARAVRVVPADAGHRMKPAALKTALAKDRAAGKRPTLIVATAGSTASGSLDPLEELVAVARRAGVWLHVDAAYGGLAAFVPALRPLLAGIEAADSVTFDPHKVLAVPLGAGAYVTRRNGSLAATFSVRAGYMPRGSGDPYASSPRWSRPFTGLATFMVLATAGFVGVARALEAQVGLADRLRGRLAEAGFRVVNDTRLPVVCFVDGLSPGGDRGVHLEQLRRAVSAAGAGWISIVRFANGKRALRACIASHRTEARDVDRLVEALAAARSPAGS